MESKVEDSYFEMATPESAGLSSSLIKKKLEKLDSYLVPMHSFLILRHKKLVLNAYWKPWQEESLHRMYSVTKSFVSIAIGVLVKDGRVKLSDSVASYFPEYAKSCTDERILACTIEDLLVMSSCHRRTSYKEGSSNWSYIPSFQKDWTASFFSVASDHDPGALFIYDTSGTQVLASIVEKVANMPLLDFLRTNFLSGTSFSKDAYILEEPNGHSAGGSGLLCRSRDLLYALYSVYKNDGEYISKEYIEMATSKRISNSLGSRFSLLDTSSGYGYQIWINSHGWMMYGMGSQLAIAIPEKDMLVVTTADTQGIEGAEALIFDCIWDIANSADDSIDEDKAAYRELCSYVDSLSVRKAGCVGYSKIEDEISGRSYSFDRNTLIGADGFSISFSDDKKTGMISILSGKMEYTYPFGMAFNIETTLPFIKYGKALSSASWQDERTLAILVQYIGQELGYQIIQVNFAQDRATMFAKQIGEVSFQGINGVASTFAYL